MIGNCSTCREVLRVLMTITSVDHAPEDLYEQVPLLVALTRQLPGLDRPDYWLGRLLHPVEWFVDGAEREVTHLVVATRWVGDRIAPGARHLPVNISYVTDESLLLDPTLELVKCAYVAIGVCDVASQA
jgi:hypothetical protein